MSEELRGEFEDVSKVVGQLQKFQTWLQVGEEEALDSVNLVDRSEIAPSIVTRSDAMMLGVSTPRFARRVHLDRVQGSFVNLRRPRLLKMGIPHGWASAHEDVTNGSGRKSYREYDYWDKCPPATFLKECPTIGDSVFSVPEEIQNEFHVVSTNLFAIYGRSEGMKDFGDFRFRQVPYLRQFKLSGQCTECALFMASALMHYHASSLFGLADISAFQEERLRYFPVRGANSNQISRIAKDKLILNVPFENAEISFRVASDGNFKEVPAEETYIAALNSYLKSGIPVLVPVDLRKMNAVYNKELDGVWTLKGVDKRELQEGNPVEGYAQFQGSDEEARHLIVLIGVAKDNPKLYLALDSASVPFLRISADELLNAVTRRGNIDSIANRESVPDLVGHNVNENDLSRPVLAPVLPPDVRGSLQQQIRELPVNLEAEVKEDLLASHSVGLMGLTALFLASLVDDESSDFELPEDSKVDFRNFRLCSTEYLLKALSLESKIREGIGRWNQQHDESKWIWLQEVGDWWFAWRADGTPYDDRNSFGEICLGYQRAEVGGIEALLPNIASMNPNYVQQQGLQSEFEELQVEIEENSPKGEADSGEGEENAPKKEAELNASVITSITAADLNTNLDLLPDDCRAIDLYTFLASDVNWLFGQGPEKSAVRVMSDYHDNLTEIRRVARVIDRAVRLRAVPLNINAFASFIPEISAFDSLIQAQAVNALVFLTRLMSELQELGHPGKVIEVVGGTRVQDLWLGQEEFDQGSGGGNDIIIGPFLVANLQDKRPLFTNLSDALVNVINRTKEADVSYAIEIEPGPLFAINNCELAAEFRGTFARSIQRLASMRVGFNLDIAHVGILLDEGVAPSARFAELGDLKDNILHAHISDHCGGHICDHPLGDIHGAGKFQEWLRFLAGIKGKSAYQGTIALELEMGGGTALERSWGNLKNLIDSIK